MSQFPIRLIISDIDGTILDDQHRVDPLLKEQIPRLTELGIPFVLASARSPLGMEPIVRELGLEDNPLACYNGALVIKGPVQHYQTLIQHTLDREEISRLLELIKQGFPDLSVNLYSGKDWIANRLDQWVELEASITGEQPQVQDLSQALPDLPDAHKLLIIGLAAEVQGLYAYLQNQDFSHTAFYLSKDNYLEVTAKHVSKEQALLEIAQHYQVPLESVMTLGDNYNDLPMLQLAGLGIAMGNAPQGLLDQVAHHTTSNQDHGAPRAIQKYILKS